MKEILLTINEAAERLNVERQFINRRVKSGEIPAAKVGHLWRIKQDDFDAWLRQQYEKRMPRGE